jgi:hypothetical protein
MTPFSGTFDKTRNSCIATNFVLKLSASTELEALLADSFMAGSL